MSPTDDSGNKIAGIRTHFHFTIFDVIDFCPGDCGSIIERPLTVPLSRLEASGYAYDVPFQVEYDGPTIAQALDPALIDPFQMNSPDGDSNTAVAGNTSSKTDNENEEEAA